MFRRPTALLGAAVLACGLVLVGGGASQAERTTSWATWSDLGGSPNAYTGTVQVDGLGFPEATLRSDSRGGGVGVQSGASTFFNAATPPGQQLGSSLDQRYLNLRPRTDTDAGASTTTYSFDGPTPAVGWAMVLGDIDADQVRVTALRADGTEASPADLGYAGSFNSCEFGTPRPAGCGSSIGDVPLWTAGIQTLTGNTGTPAFADTVGASAWFRPQVSLRSITLTYTRRSGFPVFQTWFASVNRGVSGTVEDVSTGTDVCPLTGTTVRLLDASGTQLASTTTGADGTYSFDGIALYDDLRVLVEPPGTCAVVGAREKPLSLDLPSNATDPVVDFDVREIVPQPVSGVVTVGDRGVGGVVVTLTAPDGTTTTTTTAPDGSYLFDENDVGTGYEVSIAVPDGYTGPDTLPPFDVATTPVEDRDFELVEQPSLSGTVTGGGGPLGGVQVTLTPDGGGTPLTTVTGPDGGYVVERIPAGQYAIEVTPPDGYDPEPALDGVTVGSTDVTGQDFDLTRPGAIGGRVVDEDGAGVPGVEVVIDGPGAPGTVTTDGDGSYFVDDLAAGSYTVTPTAPEGRQVRGDDSADVTLSAAGEIAGGQDFVLVPADAAPPTTPPTTEPTPEPSTPPADDADGSPGAGTGDGGAGLPDTGGPSRTLALLGGAMLGAGLLVLGGSAATRRRPGR